MTKFHQFIIFQILLQILFLILKKAFLCAFFINLPIVNIETFHDYCLSKKGTAATFPFDEHTLVFKVMGKMFALTGLENDSFEVNLKCDPDYAMELREKHPEVRAGYHMNKKHWNTVAFETGLDDELLFSLIDHSYDLVVKKLKKADREKLGL